MVTGRIAVQRRPAVADVVLLGLVATVLVPVVWMILNAFRFQRDIVGPGLSLHLTLTNFRALFAAGSTFTHQFGNSLEIVLGTTVLCVGIASLAGYSLSMLEWPRRFVYLVLSVAAVMQLVPPITLVPGLYVTLSQLGVLGHVTGLILLNTIFVLPIATILMKVYFDSLPRELRESALVDGASELRVFWRVISPLAAPGIATVAIFTAILAWNEFLFGLTMSSGPSSAPLTVWIATLVQSYTVAWGQMAAAGTIAAVPIIVIAIVANRFIVSGLTGGAIKQ